jgi:hypothetical protein
LMTSEGGCLRLSHRALTSDSEWSHDRDEPFVLASFGS